LLHCYIVPFLLYRLSWTHERHIIAVSLVFRIVGWVEVTKPFDYAVPERSRRAGQRPTSHKIGVGFRSRSTQPYNYL